ncbi:DUF4097 family beta strand repeat-containing protein [Streptomyces sp. NPDC047928]|uniref:DUF4097 family beta strand repeat-containing protein n=1 Tax=unclassified Streptomyces TaxID=2593676 RepID=UPI0037242F5A
MGVSVKRLGRAFGVAAGVLVGVVGVAGCGGVDAGAAPAESKVFPFRGESLVVDSDGSDLVLVPADVDGVEVTRQVDGWVVFGEGPSPSWRLEAGRLTLRVSCDALVDACGARHEVRVPRGVAVTVESGDGDVTADGFAGALAVRADNGDLTVRGSGGPLEVRSDNGDVRVERFAGRRLVAYSDNGDVRLAPVAVPDRVEAVSDNGSVTVELPRAGGRGATPQYAVDARSDNGTVDVAVPIDAASRHVVEARSDNGDVSVRAAN